jgi:hypothetical protein
MKALETQTCFLARIFFPCFHATAPILEVSLMNNLHPFTKMLAEMGVYGLLCYGASALGPNAAVQAGTYGFVVHGASRFGASQAVQQQMSNDEFIRKMHAACAIIPPSQSIKASILGSALVGTTFFALKQLKKALFPQSEKRFSIKNR